MRKRIIKKSDLLREGYVQGLQEGLRIIDEAIAENEELNEGAFGRLAAGVKGISSGAWQVAKNVGHLAAAGGKYIAGDSNENIKKTLNAKENVKDKAKNAQLDSLMKMFEKELLAAYADMYAKSFRRFKAEEACNQETLKATLKAIRVFLKEEPKNS